MLATVLEEFRKASESSLQTQHDLFRQSAQQWLSAMSAASHGDWARTAQRRWTALAVELLRKQKQALETLYQSSIDLIEGTARAGDLRSAQEVGQMAEEFWRRALDSLKGQSDSQFREFQSWLEKAFEMSRTPNGNGARAAEARSGS